MSKELKTGIIAVIIITLFIWGYNFLKGQELFSSSSRYFYIEYDNINGLNTSSIVSINGLRVGKVSSIDFSTDPKKRGKLLVTIALENNFKFSKNSIAKIYSAGLMGGQNLAIIPSYVGKQAKSGDFLKGEIETNSIASLNNKLIPKLERTLLGVDSLFAGFNQILNYKTRKSLNRSILNLENTLADVRKTWATANSILSDNKTKIEATLLNTKKITDDFSKVSADLNKAKLGDTVKKLETTLTAINQILDEVKNGKGTLGKLFNDEKVYNNLANATKELEELLREMKLNPKRFVHFSLFGKKAKPYTRRDNPSEDDDKY